MLSVAVKLAYSKRRWKVLMLPDANGLFWGSFLTQMSPVDFASERMLERCHHEPLELLSGLFKGFQMRWSTIDKEAFVVASTFQR